LGEVGVMLVEEVLDVVILAVVLLLPPEVSLGELLMDAQALLGRRVDVVTPGGLHPALRDRVLAEAVEL
jgi:predicted nucleotidyltransferase